MRLRILDMENVNLKVVAVPKKKKKRYGKCFVMLLQSFALQAILLIIRIFFAKKGEIHVTIMRIPASRG